VAKGVERDAHHCKFGNRFQPLLCPKGLEPCLGYKFHLSHFMFDHLGVELSVEQVFLQNGRYKLMREFETLLSERVFYPEFQSFDLWNVQH
jgi:hypothetical protein